MSTVNRARTATAIIVLAFLAVVSGWFVRPRIVGLAISAPPTSLAHGATYQLQVTARFSNRTDGDVTSGQAGTVYRVSDPGIATVSADGLLAVADEALTGAACTVTAEHGGLSAQTAIAVRNSLEATAVAGQDGGVRPSNYRLLDVVVNKQRALPPEYRPDDLVVPAVTFSFTEQSDKRLLRAPAAAALAELFDAAAAAGHQLVAVSGYRSYATQQMIFERNVALYGLAAAERFSARPGHSEHQTGLSMDVSSASVGYRLVTEFGDTPAGRWLAAHAPDFGFVIRYPRDGEAITGYMYEPWHIRFVGRGLAGAIAGAGRTLEEYFR